MTGGKGEMKKTAARILELIPVLAALVFFYVFYIGISWHAGSWLEYVGPVSVLLSLPGFIFFFIGRKLAPDDGITRILGVFDILATVSVIGFYAIAIFSFGL